MPTYLLNFYTYLDLHFTKIIIDEVSPQLRDSFAC